MKLSTILSAKSEIANEIEGRIENLDCQIKSNLQCYEGSDKPEWVIEENDLKELKIQFYKQLLKRVPGLE